MTGNNSGRTWTL